MGQQSIAKFQDDKGLLTEVPLDVTLYAEASGANLSVPAYINRKYRTNSDKYGTAFEQMIASVGLFQTGDRAMGVKPPTVKEIMDGQMATGDIIREANPASRILFPATVLAAMESRLVLHEGDYDAAFDTLIARRDSVNGGKFEFPVIDYSDVDGTRSQPIGQLAAPPTVMGIRASDVSRTIPTYSIGLEISDQAQKIVTLDYVTAVLARQAESEKELRLDEQILAMLQGDIDAGYGALPSTTAASYDASITQPGTITHVAWMKWLRARRKQRRISHVITTFDVAMAIENRSGKPVITTDDPNSPRIDARGSVVNPSWQDVKIFLVDDGVIPANTAIGVDSRYAIWEVTNTSADYQAVENFVMRRGTAMRFDHGYQYYRWYDQAFDVLTQTV